MRTRREQHQAYRFLTRRIVSALLAGEPETNELPMRRFAFAVFGSALVGLVAFAGFGVYGLLFPGGGRPAENTIIVERETGAKYLYLQGQLHPVLNWTSARLILGQPAPPVKNMSQKSLRDVPRGRPVGILNAPETLPEKAALVGLPWSVCSAPRSATSVALATHVVAGQTMAGGKALGPAEGLLVSVGGTQRYLLWHDHRLRVTDNAVIAALSWAQARPISVGEAFLNAVPAGPDLAPIALPEAGTRAQQTISGAPTTIGQLFRVGDQNYVMLRAGLAPIGEVAAQLWSSTGKRITETSAQEVGRVLVETKVEPVGLPTEVPTVRGADDRSPMVCAAYRGATDVDRPVTVETYAEVSKEMTITDQSISGKGADGVMTADRVVLPGGRGALVSTLTPAGGSAAGSVYLVTDQGIKYPLPRADVAKVQASLGYSNVAPIAVPGSILALVPTGAALDPQAAALFAEPATVNPAASARPAG